MRKIVAGVVLAAMLTLFVAVATHTSEKRAEGQETATVLMASAKCPCGGGCEVHAEVACDPTPEAWAEVGAVLNLPLGTVVSHRSDTQVSDYVVVDSRLIPGTYDIVDYVSRSWCTHDASEAAVMKGHFSVGVL